MSYSKYREELFYYEDLPTGLTPEGKTEVCTIYNLTEDPTTPGLPDKATLDSYYEVYDEAKKRLAAITYEGDILVIGGIGRTWWENVYALPSREISEEFKAALIKFGIDSALPDEGDEESSGFVPTGSPYAPVAPGGRGAELAKRFEILARTGMFIEESWGEFMAYFSTIAELREAFSVPLRFVFEKTEAYELSVKVLREAAILAGVVVPEGGKVN